MSANWSEHPEARAEVLDARDFYDDAGGPDLADEFTDAAETAVEFILDWPDTPATYPGIESDPPVRSWHVRKFPYRVVYQARPGRIWILAYAHTARRPGYWAGRLKDESPWRERGADKDKDSQKVPAESNTDKRAEQQQCQIPNYGQTQ